ncbi:MAG: helix-turn-helix domain-containing protein [Mycetocola sp.]
MDADGYAERFQRAASLRLRAELVLRGLTIKDAASAAGLSYETIRRYFSGKRDFPLPAFVQIAKLNGIDPEAVIAEADRLASE